MSREDFDLIPFHRGVHSSNFFDDTTHNAAAQKILKFKTSSETNFTRVAEEIFFRFLVILPVRLNSSSQNRGQQFLIEEFDRAFFRDSNISR